MIGFIVFTLIVGIVIYSRFYIVSNTLPNATAIRMSNLVSHYGFCEETLDISGVNIHYVSTVCDVSGCSDVIVFIHGTASCSVTFFDVMKELSIPSKRQPDPRGYACIAIDLPNFGISGNFEVDTVPTNRELCEQYADIIGHTLYKLGILERATLVAHSLGGFLSIFVANRFPIKKLVLLNPLVFSPHSANTDIIGRYFSKRVYRPPPVIFQLCPIKSRRQSGKKYSETTELNFGFIFSQIHTIQGIKFYNG